MLEKKHILQEKELYKNIMYNAQTTAKEHQSASAIEPKETGHRILTYADVVKGRKYNIDKAEPTAKEHQSTSLKDHGDVINMPDVETVGNNIPNRQL